MNASQIRETMSVAIVSVRDRTMKALLQKGHESLAAAVKTAAGKLLTMPASFWIGRGPRSNTEYAVMFCAEARILGQVMGDGLSSEECDPIRVAMDEAASMVIFPTFQAALCSVMPGDYPGYWLGVVTRIPQYEAGCIAVRKYYIDGTNLIGYWIETSVEYHRVISEYQSFDAAKAALDETAGHPEIGWYVQSVVKTDIMLHGREVTVIERTPLPAPETGTDTEEDDDSDSDA